MKHEDAGPKAPPREPLLQVAGLHAWYGQAHILHGLDLAVGRGEVVALLGRNGAGKSTTIKALMGMLARRGGTVRFMGQDIGGWPTHRIARAGLGFVPEDRRIFTELSVAENLEVGRQRPRRWPDGTPVHAWTPEALYRLFPNLAELRARPAAQMSGGEQQMLTVARTLMGNPYVVLLDEPSEGIAPLIVEQMAGMILALKAAGTSVLLSEQNLHFAQLVADRAYVLEKGQLAYEGSLQRLAADQALRRQYLGV
ncbi:ABC transporter ATP-binding protein [Orrella sp. JC864]|uniref:ABC transporter ATP-binding protein n=1 Tax=Orrella sp. JC864 TaxID=3120298 RepID=UPI0012BD43F3